MIKRDNNDMGGGYVHIPTRRINALSKEVSVAMGLHKKAGRRIIYSFGRKLRERLFRGERIDIPRFGEVHVVCRDRNRKEVEMSLLQAKRSPKGGDKIVRRAMGKKTTLAFEKSTFRISSGVITISPSPYMKKALEKVGKENSHLFPGS